MPEIGALRRVALPVFTKIRKKGLASYPFVMLEMHR